MDANFEGLDNLCQRGTVLLDTSSGPIEAHDDFHRWLSRVGNWLQERFPDAGLVGEWGSLGASSLKLGGSYFLNPENRTAHNLTIQARLRWLANLRQKMQLRESTASLLKPTAPLSGPPPHAAPTPSARYVDPTTIDRLRGLSSERFDMTRLVGMCEQVNAAFATESFIAVILLTRAILDHVPPIFGCDNFGQVANNYGTRSFKEVVLPMETGSRKIADHLLHGQIERIESLPTETQAGQPLTLDFLLSEIPRALKIKAYEARDARIAAEQAAARVAGAGVKIEWPAHLFEILSAVVELRAKELPSTPSSVSGLINLAPGLVVEHIKIFSTDGYIAYQSSGGPAAPDSTLLLTEKGWSVLRLQRR